MTHLDIAESRINWRSLVPPTRRLREWRSWAEKALTRRQRRYPYKDGPVTVIGPDLLADATGTVISWREKNFYSRARVGETALVS